MLRVNATKATFDFSDGNYRAGEIIDHSGSREGHGDLNRETAKVELPIRSHVLSRPDVPSPHYDDPIAVIYSTPAALERFCEDTLKQLRALD